MAPSWFHVSDNAQGLLLVVVFCKRDRKRNRGADIRFFGSVLVDGLGRPMGVDVVFCMVFWGCYGGLKERW